MSELPSTIPTGWQEAAQASLRRLLGADLAERIQLEVTPSPGEEETFHVTVTDGSVHVRATTCSAAFRGVHDYLETQGISVGFTAGVVDPGTILKAPAGGEFTGGTDLPHRYALNDTEDGYVGPYRDFEGWERLLDVLAFHGYNEVFIPVGIERAHVETLQQFGYTEQEALAWVPLPARQAWWLLQNMDGIAEGFNRELMDARCELGRRLVARVRELGLKPVLPGCSGTVPRDFAERNPGAHTVSQGLWNGFEQPAWLDPTTELFRQFAAAFYRNLDATVGAADLYKMDLFHEGGVPGDVSVAGAVRGVADALAAAHPDALWAILGWAQNPTPEMVAALDPAHTLVVDGVSDRYPDLDRERDWPGMDYVYGSIWNFGGHRSIGAWLDIWNVEFWERRAKPDSGLRGIAYIPEASGGYPFAFDVFSRLPWEKGPISQPEQGEQFADRHYGTSDAHARAAWRTIADVAHRRASEPFTCTHEGLFVAQPALDRQNASFWQPKQPSFDRLAFAAALPELLAVGPAVSRTAPYAEDVVEVTRQVLADSSRVWLPQIRAAYEAGDLPRFEELSSRWLTAIELLDELMGTQPNSLMGAWEAQAREGLGGTVDPDRAVEDIRGLVTYWGGDGSLLDYANREWNGLLATYYRTRWQIFFDDLRRTLVEGTPLPERDWNQFARDWSADGQISHAEQPVGDSLEVAHRAWGWLQQVDPDLAQIGR